MAISRRQPDATRTTQPKKKIMPTQAAWIPQAHCDHPPSLDEIFWAALTEKADNLLGRMPWLVALAYSLDLPYKCYDTQDLPESALEWDMKALSRQHCFTRIGVALDPGNVVYSCMLWICICRSGASVHDVEEEHMNANCAACNEMPSLTEILRNCGRADKMAQARLLLLCMQRRFSSLRFNPTCDCEKAGDVVEATGGILSPWRLSARVVLRHLDNLFGLSRDDVLEAVEAMGALARQCKIFYTQIYRSVLDEDARVPSAYATILERVVPSILPCGAGGCPVCESLAALPAFPRVPPATGPSAMSSATGLAAKSSAASVSSSATGLAPPLRAATSSAASASSSATGLAPPPPAAKSSAALPLQQATILPAFARGLTNASFGRMLGLTRSQMATEATLGDDEKVCQPSKSVPRCFMSSGMKGMERRVTMRHI